MAAGGQTNEQSEELTFGRLLITLRTQKGLDLEAISRETKIAMGTLRLMEEEAYDKLPHTVFIKGFLKAYAGVVKSPPDTLIQSFLDGRHRHTEMLRHEAGLAGHRLSFWPLCALAAMLLIGILYAAISGPPTSSKVTPAETIVSDFEPGPQADSETPVETATQEPAAQEDPEVKYLLQINAVEKTSLKIIIDRQDPKDYLLNPGDRLELKASSSFNLLIGNATGVHLQLNHRSIAVDGKRDQIVTLKLP